MAGLDLDKIRERLDLAVEGFEHAQARVGWFPTAVYEQTGGICCIDRRQK